MSASDVALIEVTLASPLDLFEDPEAEELFSYWKSCSRDGALPRWKDLNVTDIPAVVPNLTMIEVKGSPPTFTTILTGTTVVQEVGQDSTNVQVHDVAGADEVAKRLERVVETRSGYLLSNSPVTWASNDFKRHSALVLPSTDENGTITHLIGWVGDFH